MNGAGFKTAKFDRGVDKLIGNAGVDFAPLLAGYMLIASPFLCGKLKMLNLHPDLPGRFVGTWQGSNAANN